MTDPNTTEIPIPAAVDSAAILEQAREYHERVTRSLRAREVGEHLAKVYAIEAPGRQVGPGLEEAALRLAADQFRLDRSLGSLGLGCVIVHAGGDGDYVLAHCWIEGHMSRLAIFLGPVDQPDRLRPAPLGLAPCVWEASLLAYERQAYVAHVLDGVGPLTDRLRAWASEVHPDAAGR